MSTSNYTNYSKEEKDANFAQMPLSKQQIKLPQTKDKRKARKRNLLVMKKDLQLNLLEK